MVATKTIEAIGAMMTEQTEFSDEGLTEPMRVRFREFLIREGLPVDEDDEGFVLEGVEWGITCDAEAAAFMGWLASCKGGSGC